LLAAFILRALLGLAFGHALQVLAVIVARGNNSRERLRGTIVLPDGHSAQQQWNCSELNS
jgi:hypothetical protein